MLGHCPVETETITEVDGEEIERANRIQEQALDESVSPFGGVGRACHGEASLSRFGIFSFRYRYCNQSRSRPWSPLLSAARCLQSEEGEDDDPPPLDIRLSGFS
jgi:hypothetical protein